MRHRRKLWLVLPLPLLLQAGPASAEPFLPFEPVHEARPLLAKELTRSRKSHAEEAAETQDWRRIHIAKGAGFEVRQSFSVGEREMVFGVKGPLMKKRMLGLSFELRF